MKTANFLTTSCRYCRYYNPEGRRGGTCKQLGVPVQGCWKACALAAKPFNSAWEKIEEVVHLEHSLVLEHSVASSPSSHSDSIMLDSVVLDAPKQPTAV
jgi:hypothetical protein